MMDREEKNTPQPETQMINLDDFITDKIETSVNQKLLTTKKETQLSIGGLQLRAFEPIETLVKHSKDLMANKNIQSYLKFLDKEAKLNGAGYVE